MDVEPTHTPLLVLFGSQTGNAQDVAERIARQARRRWFVPRVMAADAFLLEVATLPSQPAVVFVASTTGQGEVPTNMQRLWRFLLRKSLPAGSLASVAVAVFGLGDSGYPKYNVAAKKLMRRLEALGTVPLLPLGLGDDQHPSGYEAALDAWLPRLWVALRARFPLPPGAEEPAPSDAAAELVPKFACTILPPGSAEAAAAAAQAPQYASAHEAAIAAARAFNAVEAAASGLPQAEDARSSGGHATTAAADRLSGAGAGGRDAAAAAAAAAPWGPGQPLFARLLANHRITASGHFQDVRHIELDLSAPDGSTLTYEPGDALAVVPAQRPESVAQLCERCGLDPQAWVRIEVAPGVLMPVQAAATEQRERQPSATVQLGPLVAGALDVAGASPRRLLFEVLASVAADGAEQERLVHLASAEGRDELWEYNQREGRTLLEVLHDFRSATPSLAWLLHAGPRLKPRLFSIASSQAAHPGKAHLCVAIVDWVTPYRRRRRGVCTSWLAGLQPGGRGDAANGGSSGSGGSSGGSSLLPVWIERGALRMPPDPLLPLIMVGPGTGVAPFRAFVQQRQVEAAAARASGTTLPRPSVLAFGCRSEAGDFYFRGEWEAAQREGVLAPPPLGLLTAFSRDQSHKVYVQNRIEEHGAELWRLLSEHNAVIYVAGSADKMPAQVAAAFERVAAKHGGLGPEGAAAWMRQMEAGKRYHVEAWS